MPLVILPNGDAVRASLVSAVTYSCVRAYPTGSGPDKHRVLVYLQSEPPQHVYDLPPLPSVQVCPSAVCSLSYPTEAEAKIGLGGDYQPYSGCGGGMSYDAIRYAPDNVRYLKSLHLMVPEGVTLGSHVRVLPASERTALLSDAVWGVELRLDLFEGCIAQAAVLHCVIGRSSIAAKSWWLLRDGTQRPLVNSIIPDGTPVRLFRLSDRLHTLFPGAKDGLMRLVASQFAQQLNLAALVLYSNGTQVKPWCKINNPMRDAV